MKKVFCCFVFLVFLSASSLALGEREVVDNFYDWYFAEGSAYRDHWAGAKPFFEDSLYDLFKRGFQLQPSDGRFVDYDPFVDAQMDAQKVRSNPAVQISEDLSVIKVFPTFQRGSFEGPPLRIFLRESSEGWKIANIVTTGDRSVNTKDYLIGLLDRWDERTDQNGSLLSLKDVLPGTWDYVSSSPTKTGTFQPIEPTKIYWILNADGSGIYYRKINRFNAASVHDQLRWKVEGETVTMDGDIHYTVLDWGKTWMTWVNPSKTTYFRIEKRQ